MTSAGVNRVAACGGNKKQCAQNAIMPKMVGKFNYARRTSQPRADPAKRVGRGV